MKLQWQASLSSTLKEIYASSKATSLLWGAPSVISGMQRAHTHIFLITKEPLYPFLPCCCFSVALAGFAVFFPPGTFLLALVLASLCTRRSSSKDISDWSGREHRAHLSWKASEGTSHPQTPPRGMPQSLGQWHKQWCHPCTTAQQGETTASLSLWFLSHWSLQSLPPEQSSLSLSPVSLFSLHSTAHTRPVQSIHLVQRAVQALHWALWILRGHLSVLTFPL